MTDKLQRLEKIVGNITCVESETELNTLITQFRSITHPSIVSFVNAHGMNIAANSSFFTQALSESDYLFRDGSGMKILLESIGHPAGVNANGTDLIPKIIEHLIDQRIAIFGTQQPYNENTRDWIEALGGNVVSCQDGFQSNGFYIKKALQAQPDLIILGMGMPRQEEVAHELKSHLSHPCLIINGGAILDFLGGKVERAPLWIRKLGLEWVYRLLVEPRRLAKRYLWGNIIFLLRVIRLKKHLQKNVSGLN